MRLSLHSAYCVEKLDDEVSDFAVLISMRGLHSG